MPDARIARQADFFCGTVDPYVTIFRALADPARAAILATLARTAFEICVCDFTERLELNQSTVSHHLKMLKDAGLVTSMRRGTWGFYAIAPDARERVDAALTALLPGRVPI